MQDTNSAAKFLIWAGITLVVIGLLMLWGRFLKLGSLPGDFTWSGRGWVVAFPLATCIVISIILTIVLNLVSKRH